MEVRLELRKNCQEEMESIWSLLIGYAPQENPQVMVYVVIDEPNVDNQANSKLANDNGISDYDRDIPVSRSRKNLQMLRQQMQNHLIAVRAVTAVVIHQMTWQQSPVTENRYI